MKQKCATNDVRKKGGGGGAVGDEKDKKIVLQIMDGRSPK